MPIDPKVFGQKIIDEYLSRPDAKIKLAQAMIDPLLRKRGEVRKCEKCGMPQPGIMDSMLHTDEQCLLYYVMES